ncbi:MAG TPA: hypothetical protein PKM25_12100 [Candidatus Ozemobacteraceae bacterium]|nr:hypothetical protein [Candidatus Ozemobacteraceae bacterium]
MLKSIRCTRAGKASALVFPLFAFTAFLLLAGMVLAAAPAGGQPSKNEIAVLRLFAGAAAKRHERWHAFCECACDYHTAVVIGIMNVAKRSEDVFLYHLNARLKRLGEPPVKTYITYPIVSGTQDENLAASLQIIEESIYSTSKIVAKEETAIVEEIRNMARVKLKALRWLEARIRDIRMNPGTWHWWNREYVVCSICGMPSDDLDQPQCPECGALPQDFLRVR